MARSEAFARGSRASGVLEELGWEYDDLRWIAPPSFTADQLLKRATRAERQLEDLRRCGKNMTRFFEEHTEPDGGGTNFSLSGAQATGLLARIVDGEVLLKEALGEIDFTTWELRVEKYLDRPKGEKVLDEDIN